MIETKKDEIRITTADPKVMLGKYLAENVYQTWNEDFIDEDTGECVTIERNQLLFNRGVCIDKETLSNIMFYIQSEDIKSVTVSNQKRMCAEMHSYGRWPFLATVLIGGKARKFLTYGVDIKNVIDILCDYIELNYGDNFGFTQVKAYDNCIILTDNFKPVKERNEEAEEFGKDEEGGKTAEKKFYQIESKIKYNDDSEIEQTFVVHTFDVERAMMLIDLYLSNLDKEQRAKAEKKGEVYVSLEPHPTIEAVKQLSVSRFIPKEFSDVYIKEREGKE